MKISSFDLNLFVVLNAIYTEGSLTKAAEVVGITQPAVSNALGRLREKFDDDLFIRTGSGMTPTQKTENIILDVKKALDLMQKSVNEPDEFNPETSELTFRISLSDISEERVLPYILKKIKKTAPRVSIESYQFDRKDFVHALATNQLNFVVDPVIPRSKDIKHDLIFEDEFVCAHRKNHPIGDEKKLTMKEFLSLKHINISNRRRGPSLIDVELEKLQLKRDIALRAQHFMVTPQIVKNSDYVLICSKTFAIKNNLAFQKLPIDLPKVEQHLIWHSSDDNEGPHLWMKDLLVEAFAEAQKV
jgi:DNA-binding transcriptional LysR family regulator